MLDASVALRWLLTDEHHSHADSVLRHVVAHPERFAVPELFAFEVFAVLARMHPAPAEAYRGVVLPILSGGLLRYPMTDEIASRALRFVGLGLNGYDSCYAALAEELGAVWLTFDKKADRLLAGEGLSVNLWDRLPENWQ